MTLLVAATCMVAACSPKMERKAKKVKTTENKTEGYLYYQNDHTMKGDSTLKKNP